MSKKWYIFMTLSLIYIKEIFCFILNIMYLLGSRGFQDLFGTNISCLLNISPEHWVLSSPGTTCYPWIYSRMILQYDPRNTSRLHFYKFWQQGLWFQHIHRKLIAKDPWSCLGLQCVLCSLKSAMRTVVCNVSLIVCNVSLIVCNVSLKLQVLCCTLYTANCTLHCSVFIVLCSIWEIQCNKHGSVLLYRNNTCNMS